MYDFFVQYRSFRFDDGKWSTISTDRCKNARESCHIVGKMQKTLYAQLGEVGEYRARPIHIGANQ